MKLNPQLRPPTGYRFRDADGVEHANASLDLLVEGLTKYRVRLGRPPGDPLAEITAQICAKTPRSCVADKGGFNGKLLVAGVAESLNQLLDSGAGDLVSPEVVAERVALCRKCPMNVSWEKHCPPCKRNLLAIIPETIKPAVPEKTLAGRACLLARDDLSVNVHRKDAPKVIPPGGCWRGVQ